RVAASAALSPPRMRGIWRVFSAKWGVASPEEPCAASACSGEVGRRVAQNMRERKNREHGPFPKETGDGRGKLSPPAPVTRGGLGLVDRRGVSMDGSMLRFSAAALISAFTLAGCSGGMSSLSLPSWGNDEPPPPQAAPTVALGTPSIQPEQIV